MGMCQSCDRSKFMRNLDGTNMPTSVAEKLPDGMFSRGPNTSTDQHGNNPHQPQLGRKQPREIMEYKADLNDDFLGHNLKHQLSLTKYVSTKRIKNRQIAEHIFLLIHWLRITGVRDPQLRVISYFQTFVYAWIQNTFLDIWKIAHQELFVKEMDAKAVRRKVAEQFMFELYELKEFVDAGMTNICFQIHNARSSLFDIMQYADGALLNVFKKLKEKYPQTAQTDIKDLPTEPTWPADGIKLDLFKNFQSKSFSDPSRLNYQTTYDDISFLLNTAIQLEADFKNDMKLILGDDALGCVKVALVQKNGQKQFNACAVRRIFVKWTENLLENCPELYHSRAFLNFIKAKAKIITNFYFKSTVQDTTHKVVIQILSDLLQAAKYSVSADRLRRPEFIFNIYDLLRCKIKRNSVSQVVALLQKLKATKQSPSGKKIEVVRIKNRFQTGNRDFLVNFRYGDVIIGEAQLCLDDAHVSKQAKSNHQFCHFIYELERSIFGPTLELMMQYEDVQRPDISVKFEAQGQVKNRTDQPIKNLKKTERICLNGHPMVTLTGNFTVDKKPDQTDEQAQAQVGVTACSYCGDYGATNIPYDYCFKCGVILCHNCKLHYKNNYQPENFWFSIDNPVNIPQLKCLYQADDLKKFCRDQKAPLVLFWWPGSSPSDMMKHCITLQYIKSIHLLNNYQPKIAFADITKQQVKSVCKLFNITEYPTLVLFDQSMRPLRKLIGFQWYEVPMLYKTQRQIVVQRQSHVVSLVCSQGDCQQPIRLKPKTADIRQNRVICRLCFNLNNPKDLPPQYQNLAGICAKGHYRCVGCSYAMLDAPSSYKDCFGAYLSSNFQPKLERCPIGHIFEHVRHNVFPSWIYDCCICKNKRFFDQENGIGYCKECNLAQCTHCLGYKPQTMSQCDNSMDVAFHFTQSSAEESYRCQCGQLFKKLYTGCRTSLEGYKINADDPTISWKCIFCEYQGKDGQLHLGCLCCQAMKNQPVKEGQNPKEHLEICIPCAKTSKILNKEVIPKPRKEKTHYKCHKCKHELISTCQSFGETTFDCNFCNKKYFANTERFYCEGCKNSICHYNRECKTALIKNFIPKIQHKCPQDHLLTFIPIPENQLGFCNGCMQVLHEVCYACITDDYTLCQSCIDNNGPDFVGNAFERAKEQSLIERAYMLKNGAVDILKSFADGGLEKLGGAIVEGAGDLLNEIFGD